MNNEQAPEREMTAIFKSRWKTGNAKHVLGIMRRKKTNNEGSYVLYWLGVENLGIV